MNKREEILSRLEAIKQEKKQLKKQLNELPSFEVGKWYWSYYAETKALVFVERIDKTNNDGIGYGFTYFGGFDNGIHAYEDNAKQATDQEVETALIAEAKKRGFEKGVTANSVYRGIQFCALNNELTFDYYFMAKRGCFVMYLDGMVIFKDGKWAEIIEPKSVHIPEGDYTETQLKDILNNKFNK